MASSKILDYFKQISQIPTNDVEPTFSTSSAKSVLRDDNAEPSLNQEEALKNAESVKNGLFVVPAIKNKE